MTDEVELTETAVGALGAARVGVANLMAEGDGITAQLFLSDSESGPVIVGEGDVFAAGGRRWTVVRVEKTAGSHGKVTVRPAD